MSKVVKVLKDTLNDIDGIKKFVEIDLKDVYFDSVLHPEKPGYAYLITTDKNGVFDVYAFGKNTRDFNHGMNCHDIC